MFFFSGLEKYFITLCNSFHLFGVLFIWHCFLLLTLVLRVRAFNVCLKMRVNAPESLWISLLYWLSIQTNIWTRLLRSQAIYPILQEISLNWIQNIRNILSPSLRLDVGASNGQAVTESCEQRRWESFGKDISILESCWYEKHFDFFSSYFFPDKVEIQFHMFCSLMFYRIGGEVHGADIVAEY